MLVKYVNKSVSKWVLPSVSEFNRPWAIPAVSQQFQQLFNERAKPSVSKRKQLSPLHARTGVAALFLVTKKKIGVATWKKPKSVAPGVTIRAQKD